MEYYILVNEKWQAARPPWCGQPECGTKEFPGLSPKGEVGWVEIGYCFAGSPVEWGVWSFREDKSVLPKLKPYLHLLPPPLLEEVKKRYNL